MATHLVVTDTQVHVLEPAIPSETAVRHMSARGIIVRAPFQRYAGEGPRPDHEDIGEYS